MNKKETKSEVSRKIERGIRLGIMITIGFILFIAIGGWVVMQLWNWLLPTLFGWPQVTFWQALGILALSRILFGGFGLHNSGRYSMRRRMAERKKHLAPEEQERLRVDQDPSTSEGSTK